MRVVVAIPEAHVKKPVLDAALEAVTRLNEQLIKSGESPTSHQLIRAGATWQPEAPGDEHFDHGALISKRGHGDCDDWAPLHAATLRATGEDPGATAIVRKSGRQRWHAIVRRSDGSIDDPSLAAGMPGPARAHGVAGAHVPLMRRRSEVGAYLDMPQLALRPISDRAGQIEAWQARADLPWHWLPTGTPQDAAMVALHRSPVSSQAIVGAVRGAFELGLASRDTDPEHLKRLSAIADACEGCPFEELEQDYGRQHATAAANIVGSFFGRAFRRVKRFAGPLATGALSFVPGGGVATAAFNAASPLLRKSVLHRKHRPPNKRAQAPRDYSAAPHAAPAGWLPYPYPLPYPVPGWGR